MLGYIKKMLKKRDPTGIYSFDNYKLIRMKLKTCYTAYFHFGVCKDKFIKGIDTHIFTKSLNY